MKKKTTNEILEMAEEFCDKVWYNRHQNWIYRLEQGEEKIVKTEAETKNSDGTHNHKTTLMSTFRQARKVARDMEAKYGKKNLVWDDFEWGMINGKLSALRWVLGDEWDMLDT